MIGSRKSERLSCLAIKAEQARQAIIDMEMADVTPSVMDTDALKSESKSVKDGRQHDGGGGNRVGRPAAAKDWTVVEMGIAHATIDKLPHCTPFLKSIVVRFCSTPQPTPVQAGRGITCFLTRLGKTYLKSTDGHDKCGVETKESQDHLCRTFLKRVICDGHVQSKQIVWKTAAAELIRFAAHNLDCNGGGGNVRTLVDWIDMTLRYDQLLLHVIQQEFVSPVAVR